MFAELIPEDLREAAGQELADKIAQNGQRMATGFLGTKPLLPVLTSVGQHDLATFLLQSHEFPSWGYEIDQGATSIWERWDSYTKEDGFGRHNAAMNSFAHYSFGAVCEWMFQTLAGIDSAEPGFSHIILRPSPPSPGSNAQHEPIDWVRASYDSIRGPVVSNWRVEDADFHYECEIPANTTATVYLPATDPSKVREDAKPVTQVDGIRLLGMKDGRLAMRIGSGRYKFLSAGAITPAAAALTPSKPADMSINPEKIDLSSARELVSWNFHDPGDTAKWSERHNLDVIRSGSKTLLRATGSDPQLVTRLSRQLTGPLVLELKARPEKGASAQLFWAPPGGGFSETRQVRRDLDPSDKVNSYLFGVGGSARIGQVRFDPFNDLGEMEIESITIHQPK